MITGDSQGQLLFWSFSKPAERPLASLKLSQPLLQTELHRDSGLLAVTLQDFSLQIIDIVSRKTVRSFGGHSSQLTDLCWSADARWVLTSSVDSTVKVWDVPTGMIL